MPNPLLWSDTAGSCKTMPKYYIIFIANNKKCLWNGMTATYTNNRHQSRNIIMLLLAEVTINLSMRLRNSIVDYARIVIHWAALCVDSNVNLFSLIWSITDTHMVLCNIHASKPVNWLINLLYYNAALLNAVHYQLLVSGIWLVL